MFASRSSTPEPSDPDQSGHGPSSTNQRQPVRSKKNKRTPDQPNTQIETNPEDQPQKQGFFARIGQALKPVLIPVAIMWIIQIINMLTGYWLNQFGVSPRELSGLWGIITMPLLHSSFIHLLGNTVSWLILGAAVAYVSRKFVYVTIGIWAGAGLLTWIIGRSGTVHIGASGVIYGYAAFLMVYGFLARRVVVMIISVLVILNYWTMFFGLFPRAGMSWEGHLAGAVAGVAMAFWCTREAREQRRRAQELKEFERARQNPGLHG